MTASRLQGVRDRASAIDRLNLGFLAIVMAIAVAALPGMPHPLQAALAYAALLTLLYLVGRFRASSFSPRWKAVALFVYAALFVFAVYTSFALVMPYFRAARYDDLLTGIDHAMLGVHPTVWLERITVPWLTDLLYGLYFLYFPMPLLVLVPMFARGRFDDVERWIFALLCCYYGAYLICFFLPAVGPRFHPPPGQSVPLDGVVLAAPIRDFINTLEPNKLDAFPSLHAGILTMTMLLAWHEARRTFWIFVPVAAGITLSLVYLRYHYLIDVIAGVIWAFVAFALARAIQPRLRARSAAHFGSPPAAGEGSA